MQRLARLAGGHSELIAAADCAALSKRSGPRWPATRNSSSSTARISTKFGDRTVNELKLESATLHDDPLPLFRAVGALAQQLCRGRRDQPARGVRFGGRSARGANRSGASGRPWLRIPCGAWSSAWVLRHAQRACSRSREPAARAHAPVRPRPPDLRRDRPPAPRAGSARRRARRLLSRSRRGAGFRRGPLHDDRPARASRRCASASSRDTRTARRRTIGSRRADRSTTATTFDGAERCRGCTSGDERNGLGCSPGIVRGPVRIVTDPATADLEQRAILVAEHTDPGWIMVFPSARGVLVERGSLLSHAAIVARELGIPAVVSVPGVTRWLEGRRLGGDGRQHRHRPAHSTAGRERCVAKRPRAPISAPSATRRSGRTPTSCWQASTSSRAMSASRSRRPATTRWRC